MNGRSWGAQSGAIALLRQASVAAGPYAVACSGSAASPAEDRRRERSFLVRAAAALCAVSIAACSGGVSGTTINSTATPVSASYTVGGAVSGLTGRGLELQINGGNNLSVTADGTFTFGATLATGNPYNVSVLTQPSGPAQSCLPGSATGTVGTANVTSVTIVCTTMAVGQNATIGGTISGLAGSGLVLQNDGGDNLAIASNGRFTFATSLPSGSPYGVTVLSPPINPSQNCVVAAGTGTAGASDVNNVAVVCATTTTPTYTIGGSVLGLPAGATLVLQDNGRDNLPISGNGNFTFPTPIASTSAYSVSVQSINDTSGSLSCTVQNAGGVVQSGNVTNVSVVCNNNAPLTLVLIEVTPTNPSVAKGVNRQFTATGIYSNNSTQNITSKVTWAASNTAVATVSNTSGSQGLAATTGVGATTISATSGGISGSTTLNVTAATLVSIEVTPANPSVAKGVNQQFTATGIYTDHTHQNLTTQVTWSISNSAVAGFGNSCPVTCIGLVTSLGVGSTTIRATYAGPSAPNGPVSGTSTLTVTAATLVSISVTPPNPSIAAGLTEQFTATGIYTDQTNQNLTTQVTWSSSNPKVASISNAAGSQGLATSAATGSTTITATFTGASAPNGPISGTSTLTVTPATLVSISVTPAAPRIAAGLTEQFTATGIYTDHTNQNLTTQVLWSSSNTGAASISNAAGSQGLATAVAAGSIAITATFTGVSAPNGPVSGTATLTVTAARLVSITVTPPTPSIALGLTEQFSATGIYTNHTYQNLTTQVTWSSSNAKVASVSNAAGSQGLATSAVAGSTAITATFTGASAPNGPVSGTATLTVTPATLVSISVTPAAPSIAAGLTEQFTATGIYTDQTNQNLTTQVTWSSSNPKVASISNAAGSQGLATSAVAGSTTITAIFSGPAAPNETVSGTATLTVTSAQLVSISVTPPTPSIAAGLTEQFTATGTYTNNTNQNLTAQVTWTSSDLDVASISSAAGSQGLATSAATGSTTITATFSGPAAPNGPVSGTTTLTVTTATLVSINVTPAAPTIAAGVTEQFTATGTYTNNTNQNLTAQVTWTSSNLNAASISNAVGSQGLATSAATGSTTITATFSGTSAPNGPVSGATTLTVTAATLVSIGVTPATPSVAQGLTEQFTATGHYTDNTSQNLTTQVTWSSSNIYIATISNATGSQGLANSAVSLASGQTGPTTITATFTGASAPNGPVSGTATLTVVPLTLESITVTPANPSIAAGLSIQFTATGNYNNNSTQDLTTQVTWSSSDTDVAEISNCGDCETIGVATSTLAGSTTITATLGSVSGSTTLTVTPAVLSTIAVTPADPEIYAGGTQQMTATGTYTDKTTQDLTTQVTWSSSNTNIATISNAAGSQGLATTTTTTGSTTITAAFGSVSGATTLSTYIIG
jgi:hypothetical protein